MSLEVLSLIVAVSDPLLGFLFLKKEREGKGVVGGEHPDGTDREEAMAAFGGESGCYEPGTTWGALHSLLCSGGSVVPWGLC